MSDPVTGGLALASIGASAFGATQQAYGQQYAGAAQSAMFKYQAAIADMNARLAKQDAQYALAAGDVSALESGLKTRAQIGETKAAFGAGNIAVGAGSAADVVKSEIKVGAFDQGIIRADAAKRAYGFDVQSAEDTAQAGAYRMGATTAIQGADIASLGSIIGGVGTVSSKWLQASQMGAFGGGGGYNPAMFASGGLYTG